ncbi:universal stress protein A-like protein isoform X1 [Beta vulgaris subsp. vulgaris]|uniref:universal stress protein A-like protein isoform X1 n=1 Tax=Beta vulgaris subsp. vulgaris TaxID=3555 RepID=UPI0020370A9A|nr:universal stress protein A-like protein isoform X1 [Beta vulgaris subsp. vulgaris]
MAEVAAETKVQSKVIVAIDESECSSYALKWALQNLDDKLKSGLLLFSVISIDYSGAFAGGYGSLPADLMTSMQDNQKKFVASLLAKAKEICAKHGVDADTVSVMGNPKDAICDAVQKYHCQLLVLGSHGRGAVGRAFLGSVSNYCVNHAKCPVLVVRQPF